MVVPTTTEYTRSYKPKVFVRAAKIYGDNLEFRTQKRETERNHATSPFMWDPSDTDSSDRSNAIRPLSAPPHKYKHEKFNRSYQKRLQQLEEVEEVSPRGRVREHRRRQWRSQSRSLSRGRCSGESASHPGKPSRSTPSQTNFDRVHIYRDQGVQTPDWTRMRGHKAVYASASSESSSSESLPEWQMRNNKQHNRQRRGYQSPRSGEGHSDHLASEKQDRWRIKCKGYRVQSSPSPESVQRRVYRGTACATANVNTNGVVHQSAPVPAPRKPPFVAYGCQYRDRETGHKKTHNVLAASEIHPTAIQALKRRQIEKAIKQKQSRPKSERPKSQQSMMSEFDHKMNKDTAKWVTEYQSHYPRYCNTEYERNRMSRQQQTPRSGHNYYIDW